MKIKVGTRKSRLALAQTELTVKAIKNKFPEIETEIVKITTYGDRDRSTPLSELGGKGVFIKEIESALLSGDIDIAVHSAKDLPAELAEGLEISGVLPRADCRDVLITRGGYEYDTNSELTIGTGSARRMANCLNIYKNARFKDIRGNVDTRLSKLAAGEYDGIILAAAGMERLGLIGAEGFDFRYFNTKEFLPAPCQGIIALECRKDSNAAEIIGEISDPHTEICFLAEREAIRLISGDCSLPLGALCESDGDKIHLTISADGRKRVSGSAHAAEYIRLAKELISKL